MPTGARARKRGAILGLEAQEPARPLQIEASMPVVGNAVHDCEVDLVGLDAQGQQAGGIARAEILKIFLIACIEELRCDVGTDDGRQGT